LKNVPGVIGITEISTNIDSNIGNDVEREYEIELARDVDAQAILKTAFEGGIVLTRFEHARTSLHDIFVSLAGEETREDRGAL